MDEARDFEDEESLGHLRNQVYAIISAWFAPRPQFVETLPYQLLEVVRWVGFFHGSEGEGLLRDSLNFQERSR
jgi:hypothetical protein